MTRARSLDTAALAMVDGVALRELVDMPSAIEAVRQAFVDSHRGAIEQPLRMSLASGRSLVMAAADESGDFAVKAVTVFPQNSGSLPVVQGVMFLFDGVTGSPQIGVDGPALTALRTGAASGVATSLLAVPDAQVLSVIGAGGQAWDQIAAVCAVRPIREVRISSRTANSAERLARQVAERLPGVSASVRATPAHAIEGADVICTVTTASEPLFDLHDVAPTAHLNAVGAHTPRAAELPAELVGAADLVAIDSQESAHAEAGDLIRAQEAGLFEWTRACELGALVLDPPRRSGITVFKSVGMAAQDLAVAKLAHAIATARQR